MIELILIRHAKSDWGDASLSDHDRPLNDRGLRDSPVMAERLADSGARAERLLSSTAVRARSTAEVFGAVLGQDPETDRGLYLAPPETLFDAAARTGASSVIVVAHDPGISDLARRLSDGGIDRMPTCAIARFAWNVDSWAEVLEVASSWSFDAPRRR
ncbi:SixA phosphatase family protein [Leucobacter sp. GX24907]